MQKQNKKQCFLLKYRTYSIKNCECDNWNFQIIYLYTSLDVFTSTSTPPMASDLYSSQITSSLLLFASVLFATFFLVFLHTWASCPLLWSPPPQTARYRSWLCIAIYVWICFVVYIFLSALLTNKLLFRNCVLWFIYAVDMFVFTKNYG